MKMNKKKIKIMGTTAIVMLTMGLLSLLTSAIGVGVNSSLNNKARKENFEYNEKAAEAADARTRNLYTDIQSPEAQVNQIQKAGLSPSVFYSGGDAGGLTATGAMGNGVAGLGQNYLQMGTPKEFAEVALMQAQKEKAEAEADAIKGETDPSKVDMTLKMSQAGLNDAMQQYQVTETNLKEFELAFKTENKMYAMREMRAKALNAELSSNKTFWETMHKKIQWEFDAATFKENVDIMKGRVQNLIVDSMLKLSEKEVNDEMKQKLMAETELVYEKAFYYKDENVKTAEAYQKWLGTQSENLPEQLKVMQEQLGIRKWEIAGNIIGDLIHTAGNIGAAAMIVRGKPGGLFKTKPQTFDMGANAFNTTLHGVPILR